MSRIEKKRTPLAESNNASVFCLFVYQTEMFSISSFHFLSKKDVTAPLFYSEPELYFIDALNTPDAST